MAWRGYPGPQGHDIKISEQHGTAQCNSCYAQNWGEEDDKRFRYEPHIYELDFGPCTVRLCPDCLRKLNKAIVATLD